MKNIKIFLFECLLIFLFYHLIIRPLYWLLNKSRERRAE